MIAKIVSFIYFDLSLFPTDEGLNKFQIPSSYPCLHTIFYIVNINTLLLLTNCDAHTAKYWDHSLKYGLTEMKSVRKTKVQAFFVWKEQLVNKSFIV